MLSMLSMSNLHVGCANWLECMESILGKTRLVMCFGVLLGFSFASSSASAFPCLVGTSERRLQVAAVAPVSFLPGVAYRPVLVSWRLLAQVTWPISKHGAGVGEALSNLARSVDPDEFENQKFKHPD